MGRPSVYTEAIADKIVDSMMEGLSLHTICSRPGMPSYSTAMAWKRDPEHPFSAKYARARDDRGTYWGEKIAEICMLVLQGKYDPQAARVAIDGIKWSAARMNPREYGDKIDVSADIKAVVGVLAAPIAPSTIEEWVALDRTPDDGVGALPESGGGAVNPDDPESQPIVEIDPRSNPSGVVRA